MVNDRLGGSQGFLEQLSDIIPRTVIRGGPQASGGHHQIGATQGSFKRLSDRRTSVMDGGLMIQTIAMLAQLLCHPGMMRVLGLADQQLTPSIDQFDAHGGHHSTKHTTPQ